MTTVCNGSPEQLTAAVKGWIAAPVACRPCPPQPVVMRSMEDLVGSGGLLRSTVSSFATPPLPTPLYRRPIPEALSNRMQICHATCTFQNVGSILPSGEVLAGRSTFFSPIRSGASQPPATTAALLSPSSSSSASQFLPVSVWPTTVLDSRTTRLSSEVWMCLMGVVNAAAAWTSEGHSASPDSWTEPQPAFCSQIVVVDATNPARYVDSFTLPSSVVTAMTAIPGASMKDYDVLRYSHSVWETIPFASSSPPTHYQPSQQQQQTLEEGTSSDSRSHQSAPSDAPSSPLLTESSSSIGQASITTTNALSSLHNFVTPESANDGAASENKRNSAFQAVHAGSSIIQQDFYRVERQHFYRHSCSTSSSMVGSSSCESSCPTPSIPLT
ncbi:unnamed protein product [Schistocephalus solidus]|uniref:Uncharacterized protein n=1 Tax=Schistocephalus solidus TaxID=70667 RepID=A0A3P7DA40_SCHSO|nr:unnamed protein product [Schistocephalus solidus]